MKVKTFLKSGFSIGLGLVLIGVVSSSIRVFNTSGNSVTFLQRASAQTSGCLTIYAQLSAESIDTGGSYGLVNEKTSLSTAWAKLKSASDAKTNTNGTISDGKGNVYVNYIQGSTATFQGKGYTLVGSISLSGGPDATKKIRFTKS